jgi:hypothetical protein
MSALNIADFSEEEQRLLYDQLSFKYSKDSAQVTPEQIAAWEAIHRAIGQTRGTQPLAPVIQSMGRSKFDAAVVMIHDFITKGCGLMLRKPQRMLVEEMALSCLADYLEVLDIPVTPTTMVKHVAQLEYAVNRNFPGYAKARLLHKIAKLRSAA